MPVPLQFQLVVEDDWPPVASECLPFEKSDIGYECMTAPLFVKDLSVGDVIEVQESTGGHVSSWSHLSRSERSTIWLLRMSDSDQIESCLQRLRLLGCNTTSAVEIGCYAIDVPEALPISDVDAVLETLNSDSVAVAFPSMRHAE